MALCWLFFFRALLLGASNFVAKHSSFFVFFSLQRRVFFQFWWKRHSRFPNNRFHKEISIISGWWRKNQSAFLNIAEIRLGFPKNFFLILLKDPLFTFGKVPAESKPSRSLRYDSPDSACWMSHFFIIFQINAILQIVPDENSDFIHLNDFFSPRIKRTFEHCCQSCTRKSVNLERSPQKYNKQHFLCQQTSA